MVAHPFFAQKVTEPGCSRFGWWLFCGYQVMVLSLKQFSQPLIAPPWHRSQFLQDFIFEHPGLSQLEHTFSITFLPAQKIEPYRWPRQFLVCLPVRLLM
jgi:hypothetical protein